MIRLINGYKTLLHKSKWDNFQHILGAKKIGSCALINGKKPVAEMQQSSSVGVKRITAPKEVIQSFL